jgi:hypothetical protein
VSSHSGVKLVDLLDTDEFQMLATVFHALFSSRNGSRCSPRIFNFFGGGGGGSCPSGYIFFMFNFKNHVIKIVSNIVVM